MPKITLEEKRRETLRRQLYGKEVTTPKAVKRHSADYKQENTKTFSMTDYSPSTSNTELLTTNYLSHDLTKILIFSTLAIGTQLSIYFLLQKDLIKLPF